MVVLLLLLTWDAVFVFLCPPLVCLSTTSESMCAEMSLCGIMMTLTFAQVAAATAGNSAGQNNSLKFIGSLKSRKYITSSTGHSRSRPSILSRPSSRSWVPRRAGKET